VAVAVARLVSPGFSRFHSRMCCVTAEGTASEHLTHNTRYLSVCNCVKDKLTAHSHSSEFTTRTRRNEQCYPS
jgi:hypothetical protein